MAPFRTCIGAGLMLFTLAWGGAARAQPIDYGEDLPDPGIPGYSFPASEDSLLDAVNRGNWTAISTHGWGLWAALTSPSNETAYGIPSAPVYLTWLTKSQLAALSQTPPRSTNLVPETRMLELGPATQLLKFGVDTTAQAPSLRAKKGASGISPNTATFTTVAYSPPAARHLYTQGLFKLATIRGLFKPGAIGKVPAFPTNAVVIKPVYKIVSSKQLLKGRYFVMPAWPGTPPVTPKIVADGFPEGSWRGCVYVDTLNTGTSVSTGIDLGCGGPTPETTYALGDFIGYQVTADNKDAFSAKGHTVVAGDRILLMAMHVSTREMTEWTWQTFFWTPTPKSPPLPSRDFIAATQPSQLTGAATRYAMSIAYQMITPNQPVNGGTNVGEPIVAYNPYLEADFTATNFDVSRPVVNPSSGISWTGRVGVETNCMTCHSLAALTPSDFTAPKDRYGTTFYIAQDDPLFIDTVQTDFLWSIPTVVKEQIPGKKK